jgi:hypothetical protein
MSGMPQHQTSIEASSTVEPQLLFPFDDDLFTPRKYLYRPLDTPSTIRILLLEPGELEDPLHGELRHIDIGAAYEESKQSDTVVTSSQSHDRSLLQQESPPSHYEALSYVWGEPVYTCTLTTSQGCISLTPNLKQALQHIRLPDSVRPIWADAVCINQTNLQERGQQVKLMGQIYSKAGRVLIWLGTDPHHRAHTAFVALNWEHPSYQRWRDRYDFVGSSLTAITDVLKFPWFSRLWVVQELLLAAGATFFWGSEQIDFKYFHFALLICLLDLGLPPQQWMLKSRPNREFLRLLAQTRALQCSDERDRIYAMLSLGYSETDQLSQMITTIEPDYTKPAGDLFSEVARLCVQCNKVLELLAEVCHDPRKDAASIFPSWVPKWSQCSSFVPLDTSYHNGNFRAPATPLLIEEILPTLTLPGNKVDTITYAMDSELDPDDLKSTIDRLVEFWVCRIRVRNNPLPPEERTRNFIRALTCGNHCCDPNDDWTKTVHDLLGSLGASEDLVSRVRNCSGVRKVVESITSHCKQNHMRLWRHRKLFQTATGHVGLGPAVLQVDDDVVFIQTTTTFYDFLRGTFFITAIVRRKGANYMFLGTACIPEQITESKEKELKETPMSYFVFE